MALSALGGLLPTLQFLGGGGRNISKGGESRQLLARRGDLKLTKRQARQLGLREGEFVEDTREQEKAEAKRLQQEQRELAAAERERRTELETPFHLRTPEEQQAILEGKKRLAEATRRPLQPKGPTAAEQKAAEKQATRRRLLGMGPEVPAQPDLGPGMDLPPMQSAAVPGGVPLTPQPTFQEQFEQMSRPAAPDFAPVAPAPKPPKSVFPDATPEERKLFEAGEVSAEWMSSRARERKAVAKKEQTAADKAKIEQEKEIQEREKEVSAIKQVRPGMDDREARRLQSIGVTAKDLWKQDQAAQKAEQDRERKRLQEVEDQQVEIESTDAAKKVFELMTDPDVPLSVKHRASVALQAKADAGDRRATEAIRKIQEMETKARGIVGGSSRQATGERRRAELRQEFSEF